MTDRELMQQALDALDAYSWEQVQVAANALRDRLAQPEQEPVAWMYVNQDGECEQIEYAAPPDDPSVTPLYTTPPQRPWVGLTDDDYETLSQYAFVEVIEKVEALLKEKNNG